MATTYLSPGVYVEEVDRGTKPIQGVGTSLTAFVGVTAEASVKRINRRTGNREVVESRLNKPTLITSWTNYVAVFGEFVSGAYLPDAIYGYFANGGGPCYVTSLRAVTEAEAGAVAATAVISAAKGNSFTATASIPGDIGNNLTVTVTHDPADGDKAPTTFSLVVGDQSATGLSMKKSDDNHIGNASFDAITISKVGAATAMPAEGTYLLSGGGFPPLKEADYIGSEAERTGILGMAAIDEVRLVTCPDLMANYDGSDDAKKFVRSVQTAMVAHCEQMRYRFAILDAPPGMNPQEIQDWRDELNLDSSYAALYYPWVEVPDLINGGTKLAPPSGYIAGVYNRTDSDRGVHKAPANETVLGAVGVEMQISRGEQGLLNPKGINCIRAFPGRGIRVWGARTLSSDGSWRYINVRRLFIHVAASLDTGLQWVVFEPNNDTLWAKVRRDVTAFLRTVWGSGALFGQSETEAFYIKCDAELNTAEVRDLGQLIIEVGISPVKPAEFVIFRLSQWAGAEGGGEDEGGGDE
ncbi:MAG: phage tail sheath family protein [Chloroflexi bacterium]|nr:phage tail sheath family protein [Chloroflexota bacterium]